MIPLSFSQMDWTENPEITYGTEMYKNFAEALHTINEYLAKKIARRRRRRNSII